MPSPRIQDAPLLQRWLYALKPASWPKVLAPAVLGICLTLGHPDADLTAGLLLASLHAVATVSFLVTTNDWVDQRVDAIKRRRFPDGCSPKTIPDGILPARALGAAALLCAGLMIALGAIAGYRHQSLQPLLFSVLGIVALGAYSLPPFKLNYRGGGELLEAAGVGLGMPIAAASFLYPLPLEGPLLWLLAGLVFTSLASAIASGLSDEESDREGGKRTFTTALGNSAARNLSLASLALGGAIWFAAHLDGTLPRITAIPLLTLIAFGLQAQGRSAAAITGAFSAQASFKQALHRAIWGSTFAWALLIALTGFPS